MIDLHHIQTAIIGAGPAGLAAAIEIAQSGGNVILLDENSKPGGQLFKQIHKFFGSREHLAGVRGYKIGEQLLNATKQLGVKVLLNAPVIALYPDKTISYIYNRKEYLLKAEKIIIATGATENTLAFPGSTLPGIMGAGAAQTLINVHRVLPGKKILMVGSGNVGLIVTYQLMQAGAEVEALIEAAPQLGGYEVHAAKIRRAGVPIYLTHSISKALGTDLVEAAEIVQLDKNWQPIKGTEKLLTVDTICLAVGLSPLTELAWLIGCKFSFNSSLGGHLPQHDTNMETTVSGVYVAGDITGIEEASTALEEGRLAGIACAQALGLYDPLTAEKLKENVRKRLASLRTGPFAKKAKHTLVMI